MARAVQFGAGNIGRGFIGALLHEAGFDVVFADVVPAVVDLINREQSYRVIPLSADAVPQRVDGVRAVQFGSEACTQAVAAADVVTTAVGIGNLPGVGQVLLDGFQLRRQLGGDGIVHVMACENAVRATSQLKDWLYAHADEALVRWMDEHVGFVDVAVDRIVPNVQDDSKQPLDVFVEPDFEWDIETPSLKCELPLSRATFVQDLNPFLERKLFLLNGAHAAVAYGGYRKHCQTIADAMKEPQVQRLVEALQAEVGQALAHHHSVFTLEQLAAYAESVRRRFANPQIPDEVRRVARDPRRKLASNDRLVRPWRMAMDVLQDTPALETAIALGLLYDHPEDAAAMEIQELIKTQGIDAAITAVTGVSDEASVARLARAYARARAEWA
ncbi:mannitol-1-phosphate 5-dehydrogenase [Alicyclobacillus contaminans]|uniref:mannitol-1-phosphate 5-dehydrogenase n=1 Tax=Alicyclobacillus contaminans TaxID=392016 RepID=UPI00040AF118|nr:mannitol-1-phosphate 5-dehydrogenase [Alicyclobacillus contaminans]GMA51500.1 mannitol-1-phosphate 5-dehydrogenase [Alicyclobacillus contaminans]